MAASCDSATWSQAGARGRSVCRNGRAASPPHLPCWGGSRESSSPFQWVSVPKSMVVAGEVMWRPTEEQRRTCNLARYLEWLATRRDLHFRDYQELWHWSVTDLEGFWASIWDYFEVGPPGAYDRVLAEDRMPGAKWFPGARLNYAARALKRRDDHPALIFRSEARGLD